MSLTKKDEKKFKKEL